MSVRTVSSGPFSGARARFRRRATPPCAAAGGSRGEAGGGIKGGIAVGETDENGRDPFPEFEPKDLHATIATALGMDVEKRYHPKGAGRPSFVGGRGKPIDALLG